MIVGGLDGKMFGVRVEIPVTRWGGARMSWSCGVWELVFTQAAFQESR